MDGLTVGRIVHFVISDELGGYYNLQEGEEYPMIITRVKDKQKGIVNGQVFLDDAVYFAQDIVYSHSDEPLPNSWHWVERA